MKRQYDEVMDKIEVTDTMRRRILDNIQKMDLSPAHRAVRFPHRKRYLSAAACFALLLAGAIALPRLMPREMPEPPPVQVIPKIEEASSLRHLSDLVGFEVAEEFALPFVPEQISYVAYWSELAEVTYSDGAQSAVFRKSAGTENNSGDYTTYHSTAEISAGGWIVTLSGEGAAYSLAVWTDGTFSYSLRLSQAISKEDWQAVFHTS